MNERVVNDRTAIEIRERKWSKIEGLKPIT
jgi:hypothetical protein